MSAFIGTMCAMNGRTKLRLTKIALALVTMGIGACATIAILNIVHTFAHGLAQPQHAVCLQSHREVVLIPTICGAHDICQKPIVTEVCDRIQAPPPRPMCQGNSDDD